MGQPQHGYTTRTARAEAHPEDSGISSRQLQATRGCQVSRATRHEGTRDPDKQPHHHQKQRQSGGAAPVQKRCIAYGSGAALQYTRTNAELANRATPHHNQPEHRTPGGHRADVEQLCCTLLTLPHRKSHPQHHLTSNRAQTVVRFAPNTLFQPDFTEVDCTLDTPSRTGNHTTTRTARAKTPPVGFGRASGRTLRTKRGTRSRGRPGPKAPTTRATIRQPGAAFVLNTSAHPDPTDGGAGTRPTLPPIELTHAARGLGNPQSADSATERAEMSRPNRANLRHPRSPRTAPQKSQTIPLHLFHDLTSRDCSSANVSTSLKS